MTSNPTQNPQEHNRYAWDKRVREGQRFTRPLSPDDLANPKRGLDPWIDNNSVQGKRVLCLGAGGGRQGVQYALCGADVTVNDISDEQLALDRQAAQSYKLPNLRTLQASMDDLSELHPASFDIVTQPVSTCYVPDIKRVYREIARILKPHGQYLSQHKQPTSLQADTRRGPRGYEITTPYDHQDPLPNVEGSPHREPGTLEFLHPWASLVGGMCQAGFIIENLEEPNHTKPGARPGSFEDRSRFIPPYVRIKARRTDTQPPKASTILIAP